jgi:hypothetical protein
MSSKFLFSFSCRLFSRGIGVNLCSRVYRETPSAMKFKQRFFQLAFFMIFLLSVWGIHAQAATERKLMYKVLVSDEQKGNLDAQLIQENESTFSIRLITQFEVLFLNIKSDIQLRYENGKMVSAETSKYINGIRTEHTVVTNHYGTYKITGSDIDDLTLSVPVTFSVGRLYHFEPVGHSKMLSERLGKEVEIRTIGKHAYELRQPDGDRNYFFYKNGICNEMQTRMKGKAVRFVLE